MIFNELDWIIVYELSTVNTFFEVDYLHSSRVQREREVGGEPKEGTAARSTAALNAQCTLLRNTFD